MPRCRGTVRAARTAAVAAVLLFTCVSAIPAQSWRVQAGLGNVYNFRTPLTIHQNGYPRIRFDARYATRGFEKPFYWAVRVDRLIGGARWGVELVHDKLYLQNRPPEVERFNITHGFNIVSLFRTSAGDGLGYRVGIGAFLAHAENTVRGQALAETGGVRGYHLTGPVAQASVVANRTLFGGTGVFAEARLLGGRARVPVHDGDARFWAIGAHFSAGLSQRF
jgi:hypothetical protein